MPRNKNKNKSSKSQVDMVHLHATLVDDGAGATASSSRRGSGPTFELQGVGILTGSRRGSGSSGLQMRLLPGDPKDIDMSPEMLAKAHSAAVAAAAAAAVSGGYPTKMVAVQITTSKKKSGTGATGPTPVPPPRNCNSGTDSSGIGGGMSSGSGRTTPAKSPTPMSTSLNSGASKNKDTANNLNKTAKNLPSKPATVGNSVVGGNKTATTTTGGGRGRQVLKVGQVVQLDTPEESKGRFRLRSHPDSTNNCSCPCCGELFLDGSDLEDYYTGTGSEFSTGEESELDEDSLRERNRMNQLLMENAKLKVVFQKNKYFNKILSTQKIVRDQQLMVLERANSLNAKFVRNMEAVMRFGYCPLLLQQRTDGLSRGLLDVHKLIQKWDERLEDLISEPKPKGNNSKTLPPTLLQVFQEKFGPNLGTMTDAQFEDALKQSMDELPELQDEASAKRALEEMDLSFEVEMEWEAFECNVESHLHSLEVEFIELCVEFGLRVRLPDVPGYEWAHAVGRVGPRRLGHARKNEAGLPGPGPRGGVSTSQSATTGVKT